MDGLPIQENNDFYFVSKNNGISHACGHDGHMAILLGVINILSKVNKTKYKVNQTALLSRKELGSLNVKQLRRQNLMEIS